MAQGHAQLPTTHLRTLCFITDRDRVLLLKRRHPPNQGRYNAPGGKIEPDEDPYEACLREVHEETGLRLGCARLRGVLTVISRTAGAQWLLFVFVAERPPAEPDPIATDEGELVWIPMAEIASLPVVEDIPLVLPRVLAPGSDVVLGKIHAEGDTLVDYVFRDA